MRLAVLSLLVAFVAAIAGAHTQAASPSGVRPHGITGTCHRGSVPGVINGKYRCLRAGQRCVKRFDRQYHRYGFHCHTGRLRGDAWIALESRPLHLPRIEPGAACPRSTGRQVDPNFGIAYGDGPAYPVMGVGDDGVVHYGDSRREGGWYYVKVLWVVDPQHRERTLVRGLQIDGRSELRFEFGPEPAKELRIPRWGTVGSGWGHRPSESRIRAQGCYAYQADGRDFSTVIVFQAAP